MGARMNNFPEGINFDGDGIIQSLDRDERVALKCLLDLEKYGYSSWRDPRPSTCIKLHDKDLMKATSVGWDLTAKGRIVALMLPAID